MKTIKEFFQSRRRGAAMTVMTKGDRALILQRSHREKWMPGYWNLPGGRIESGETPKNAATRECHEESGITPQNLTLWKVIKKQNIDLYVYRGECDENADVMLDPNESTDYAWIGVDRLDSYRFVPDCRDWINDTLTAKEPAE